MLVSSQLYKRSLNTELTGHADQQTIHCFRLKIQQTMSLAFGRTSDAETSRRAAEESAYWCQGIGKLYLRPSRLEL